MKRVLAMLCAFAGVMVGGIVVGATGAGAMPAATTTTANNAYPAQYDALAQSENLSANVTSTAGNVDEGTVVITVSDPTSHAVICTSAPAPVWNGLASGSCTLPGGTALGTYSITAVFTDSSAGHFLGSASTNNATLVMLPGTIDLQAYPAKAGVLTLTVSARVSRDVNNEPIPNEKIVFSYNGRTLCVGTSNAAGIGSCTFFGLVVGPATYVATVYSTLTYGNRASSASL